MSLTEILDTTDMAVENKHDKRLCHVIENELYSMIHNENSYGSLKNVYKMLKQLH